MVADVVFKHNGWKQARSLAELMQLILSRSYCVPRALLLPRKKKHDEGHEMSMSVVEFLSSLESRTHSLLAALSCVLRHERENRMQLCFVCFETNKNILLLDSSSMALDHKRSSACTFFKHFCEAGEKTGLALW